MAKAMTEEVLIGKFDILATYTYAKALLDDEPEFRRDHLDERDDPNRIIGGLVSDLAQWRLVSGRSKPASDGRLKTSHFEETQIRQIGSKESPFSLEHYHAVSDQSGHNRHHFVAASQGLVPASDRKRAGHQSRDRRTLPQAGRFDVKTSQCAHRLRHA